MREELQNEVLDLITGSLIDHACGNLKPREWIGDFTLSGDFTQEEEQKLRRVQREFMTLCEKWKREAYRNGFVNGLYNPSK